MDNQFDIQPPQNPQATRTIKKSSKYLLAGLVLVVLIAAAMWLKFEKKQPSPQVLVPSPANKVVISSADVLHQATNTPLSNFKSYDTSSLPPQFPSDFPNPAKDQDILINNSKTIPLSKPIIDSTFKFTTTDSQDDIVKLYTDYLTKNAWSLQQKQLDPYLLLAEKDSDTVNIALAQQPGQILIVTLSMISQSSK